MNTTEFIKINFAQIFFKQEREKSFLYYWNCYIVRNIKSHCITSSLIPFDNWWLTDSQVLKLKHPLTVIQSHNYQWKKKSLMHFTQHASQNSLDLATVFCMEFLKTWGLFLSSSKHWTRSCDHACLVWKFLIGVCLTICLRKVVLQLHVEAMPTITVWNYIGTSFKSEKYEKHTFSFICLSFSQILLKIR